MTNEIEHDKPDAITLLRADNERLREALREAASDFQMSLQIDKQKDAKIEQLTEALRGVVDDEPCWLDHHGYCQTHGLGNPCEMAIARAVLEGESPTDGTDPRYIGKKV